MWALRVGVPLAAVGLVVALRPEIVTGTFSSVESVLKVLGLLVAWVVFSFLVRRFVTNAAARTAIIAVAGAALLFVTVLPYFRDKSVNDALPTASSPATTAAVAADTPAAPTSPSPSPSPTVAPAPVPTGPQKVTTGQLRGLAGHRGAGEAAVYRQPDGSHLVRLEDFDVSSVPAPVLYLVPGANRQGIDGAIKLGGLRGNNGSQNFTVPAGTEVGGSQTVLIWCEAFSVPVAGATQAPA